MELAHCWLLCLTGTNPLQTRPTVSGTILVWRLKNLETETLDPRGSDRHQREDLVTITVEGNPPPGMVGYAYHTELTAVGGAPPYVWTIDSPLPDGLALVSRSDGRRAAIQGVPAEAGSRTWTISVTDSASDTASYELSLDINPRRETSQSGSNLSRNEPSYLSQSQLVRILLAGAFPLAVTGAIVAFGLSLQLRGGRTTSPTATLAAQLIGVSVAAGIASMATLQVVKALLGVRGLYQRRQVLGWFSHEPFGNRGLMEFLEALGAAGTSDRQALRYLFDLPIELVCAQVSGAADVALAEPERFPAFLGSLAGEGAVSGVVTARNTDHESSDTQRTDSALADRADGELRLSHYVRTGIDKLQVSVGHRWRTYIRATAVWLSGLVGIAIVEVSQPPAQERGLYILSAVLVGGFVSWFARDVVAAVERLRG